MVKTEIVFLLDRSGSMMGKEAELISGYNSFILQHTTPDDSCIVTTVLFDDAYEILFDAVPAQNAQLKKQQYYVRGFTALCDAIGRAIHLVGERHAAMTKSKRPKVYFVVSTDGYENASREYNKGMIKQLIEKQQRKHAWEFLFIGCDIDAVTSADELGIPSENSYACSSEDEDFFCDILNVMNSKIESR